MAIAYLIITDYSKRAKRDGKQAIHIHFPESLSKMGWNIRSKRPLSQKLGANDRKRADRDGDGFRIRERVGFAALHPPYYCSPIKPLAKMATT